MSIIFKAIATVLTVLSLTLLPVASAWAGYPWSPVPVQNLDAYQHPFGFKSPEAYIHWMGCKVVPKVYYDLQDWRVNAYFDSNREWYNTKEHPPEIHILGGLLVAMTPDEVAQVLAHETGHCMQFQEGRLPLYPSTIEEVRNIEWDADAFSVRITTVLGHPAIITDALKALAKAYNRPLDWGTETNHGSVLQRLAYAYTHTGLVRPVIMGW